MRSFGSWLALGLCACLWAPLPGSAQTADPSVLHARELFQRGVDAYDRGVYFDALQAFQEAYRLRPHPAVRVNIANCYEKLDRPAEAIQNFEQFLASGAGSAKQQAEVVAALDQLRKRVGRLVLRVTPDGAKVVIDEGEPMYAPISDVVSLKVGRHKLTASLDLHETAMRAVDIHAESTTELDIALPALSPTLPIVAAVAAPIPPPPAATPETQPPAPTPPPAAPVPDLAVPVPPPPATAPEVPNSEAPHVSTGAWIAGSVTLAALVTSIVTGQLALSADREFNADLAAVRNPGLSVAERTEAWQDGIEAADRAQAYAITTDVLLGCAIVGAVLTTVLYLNGRKPESNTAQARASGGLVRLRANF